mmetsp:Transcript_36720/g.117999  ORF Transcript_36720/g.117999 Transcript_36720/m.117999 type:complete len:99 (+) Transcript_36720:327-623(+)
MPHAMRFASRSKVCASTFCAHTLCALLAAICVAHVHAHRSYAVGPPCLPKIEQSAWLSVIVRILLWHKGHAATVILATGRCAIRPQDDCAYGIALHQE